MKIDIILYSIFLLCIGVCGGLMLTSAKIDDYETTIYNDHKPSRITTEPNTNPVDGVIVTNKINVDTFQIVNNIDTVYDYKFEAKEWFAFINSKYKYQYDPIPYTDEELNIFTNILYRESRASQTLNQEVDQYFVAICGIQTIIGLKKHKSIMDLVKNGHSFTWPAYGSTERYDNKDWVQCRKVCKNVLECKIPTFVPYIPTGTIAYWNARLDTNMKQKAHLEANYICIASTTWDHHYYCHLKYITKEELDYLKDNQLVCNPIKKNISNGALCSK